MNVQEVYVTMKKYKVIGMQCASCAIALENILKKQNYVNEVRVSYANQSINLDTTDFEACKHIAIDLGFEIVNPKLNTLHLKIHPIDYDVFNKIPNLKNYKIRKNMITIQHTSTNHVLFEYFNQNGITYTQVHPTDINFIILLIAGILLFIISMFPMLHIPVPIHQTLNIILQILLTSIIIYYSQDVLFSGCKKLIKKIPNMDSLIFIGVSASLLYSFIHVILMINSPHHIMLHFETAGMILVFVKIGKKIEEKSKIKSLNAMQNLLTLTPKTATLIDGSEKHIDDVQTDEIITLKSGMIFPLDGIITKGSCTVDESLLTGESIPKNKSTDENVFAGTLNQNGYIEYRVTKKNTDSVLSQIIQLVQNAQSSKAPIAKVADILSGYFVWGILAIAIITSTIWLFLGKDFNFILNVVLTILVIACPCALGLATPIAIVVASSKASQLHILFKNASAIQTLAKIDYVVFDKTGTLTTNKLQLHQVYAFENYDILQIAASLEQYSNHPLAKTIYESQTTHLPVINYQEHESKGISGIIENTLYFIGNLKLMQQNNIEYQFAIDKYNMLSKHGETILFLATNKRVIGLLSITNPIQPNASKVIKYLNEHKIQSIVVSGDAKESVQSICDQLNISNYYSQVLPEDKYHIIKSLQKNYRVAMIGDGINDAIALTQADVGIAIAQGSEIATNSAEVILMKSDIFDVVIAIKLAKKTMRIIYQNLFWAFIYNTFGIILATGMLSTLNITLHPMFAAFAMSISSITVVLNSLRLNNFQHKTKNCR